MGQIKVNGICHICGIEGPLSFEHVPPKKAFNDRHIVQKKINHWLAEGLELGSRKGKHLQGGGGEYTLCERCNNCTGSWYGPEYVRWAQHAFEMLGQIPAGAAPFKALIQGYPLRFIKQAITMFFSVNSPGYRNSHPELVRFVLDKNSTGLPPYVHVYLTLVKGPHARSSGVSGNYDIDAKSISVMTEVAHPPFALTMMFDFPKSYDLGNITHFAKYKYDEKAPVGVLLQTGYINTPYPDDYRSKDQILKDVERTKKN